MRPPKLVAPFTMLARSILSSWVLIMIPLSPAFARQRKDVPRSIIPASYSFGSSYPVTLPKSSREIFVVNFELGFFACQLNASSDFLEVYSLSRLCDGARDCFSGTDENRDYVPCSSECSSKCAHGVCLASSTKSECFCDDGYSSCDCSTPAVNECKYRPCDIFAKCTNTLDSYYCTCLPGFTGDGKTCSDIDECANPQIASTCVANAECCNVPGSYLCRCLPGFRGDGRQQCVDINECVEGNPCPSGSQCQNTAGSYTCSCLLGFTFDTRKGQCVDINECIVVGCAAGAMCKNYDGGYECSCQDAAVDAYDTRASCNAKEIAPYPRSTFPSYNDACLCGPGAICVMRGLQTQCICPPGTFGEPSNQRTGCIPSYPIPCNPSVCTGNAVCQGMQCVCALGFQGTPPNCVDINECVDRPCAANAECINVPGSYRCQCPGNLRARNPFNPQDGCIGACEMKQCGRGALCVERQPGTAYCQCPAGYAGIPEIECVLVACPSNPEEVCGRNALCNVNSGQRVCTCMPGFRGNPPNQQCIDINECVENPCAKGALCQNTIGSYTCTCPPNTIIGNAYGRRDSCRTCPEGSSPISATQCGRVSECLVGSPCGPNGQCADTDDGHVCQCQPGFTTINGRCVDINECANKPCAQGGVCENSPGSYSCRCPSGFSNKLAFDRTSTCSREIIVVATGTPCDDFPCWKAGSCTFDKGDDSCYCKDGFDGSPDATCVPQRVVLPPTPPPTLVTFPPPEIDKSVICLYDRCRCAPGFQGRYPNCIRVNECAENPCRPGSCSVASPGKIVCTCPRGYQSQNGRCVSINECVSSRAPCAPGSCIPTPGSYKCVCPNNYKSIDGKCAEINECQNNPDVCSPGNCLSLAGTYRCECPAGFYFTDGICGDVNECSYNPCSPGKCNNLVGSYECSCPRGYNQINGQCVSVDLCAVSPCGPSGVCVGKPGGYQCACINGFTFDGTTCVDVNECIENPDLCRPGSCMNTEGSYVCKCPRGFTFRDGVCSDINECVVARPCGIGMRDCVNTIGAYSCSCRTGYQFNGVSCVDINECAMSPNLCLPGSCRNTEGSYVCICPAGYEFSVSKGACVDVNECSQQPCAKNALCTNTIGSYECRCPPEFKVGSAFESADVCLRINLCETKKCPDDSVCILDTNIPRCICREGFSGIPGNCRPSQCQMITCGQYSTCLPVSEGGVACMCNEGFHLIMNANNAAVCVDINECADSPNVCANGKCQNTLGSYQCSCRPGFTFNGVSCEDIDECSMPDTCSTTPGSLCLNTLGSFECRCPTGLIKANGQCSFVRLCEQSSPCGSGQCMDVPQSYRCSCPNGFQFINGTCVAINQCILLNPCGPGASCQDLGGRYTCFCPKGFAFDDLTCVDVNECVRNPCGIGARECVNTKGSYSCTCRPGYRFNGKTCEDINECVSPANPCEPGQCVNLPGSFSCVCPAGYEQMNGQECIRINQCIYNPCSIGTCIEDMVGGYTCQCPLGYEFTNGMCEDINECFEAPDLCLPGACINTVGSFQCRCPKGFQQVHGTCVAISHCTVPGICGVGISGAVCTDLLDGSFQCSCPIGYSSTRGSACVSVNECADNPCSPGSCANQPGGYVCACPPGYQSQNGRCTAVGCERAACSPNSRCLINERSEISCHCAFGFRESNGGCVAINECTDRGRNPCGEAGKCLPTDNGYDCQCPQGWQTVGYPPQCVDIDECALYNPCLVGTCLNTKGSYTCTCPAGYQFDRGHCVDVNECAGPNPPCSPGQCRNLEGAYECYCPLGYEQRSGQCVSVKECAIYNPCLPGQCQDIPGGYRCACPKGWMAASLGGNCTEINECIPVNPCGQGTCRKQIGSYTCDCLPGYQFLNGRCVDVNECSDNRNPCILGRCINTDGAYSCVCPRGYFFNGRFCEDRNECVEFMGDLCPGGGTCVNSPGSYRCVCPPGLDLIDGRCISLNTCEYVPCGVKSLQCRDAPEGPICECPPGYYGDPRVACAPIPSCESMRDCGPHAECSIQMNGNNWKVVCRCRAGYFGTPPSVPCDRPCPDGMTKDLTNGICARATETSCIQTSCSPGVCQTPGTSDDTPLCLCPEGTRYLWDRGVCAIIPPRCGPPNPCLPGKCLPDGYTFKCECPVGYVYMNGACMDVNECVENPTICGVGGTCTNRPGTYNCQCAPGFELRDNQCFAIDQCVGPVNPCEPGQCKSTGGSYQCICPDGFRFLPTPVGTCSRVLTPCVQQKDLCSPGQCQALGEFNYRCQCPPGFSFDGVSCIQINQCATSPCGAGTCKNLVGHYECSCPRGFRNDGRTCIDIDECAESAPCGTGTCQNAQGAYTCICRPGFEFDGSSCIDVNECTSRNRPDCGDGQCENTVGSYRCHCLPGFRNAGFLIAAGSASGPCVDIQECSDNPQPCNPGQCLETKGGYQCKCPIGYQFLNGACVQINFCVIDDKCKPGKCALMEGTFICTCPAGYTSSSLPAKDCIQVNECALQPAPCGPGAVNCIDTLGSYQCLCGPGYQLSEDRKLCIDVNECAGPISPCNPGDCGNLQGSYFCMCPVGFSNSTGIGCTAVNECAGPVNPCLPGTCTDLIGSYQCNCPTGYQFINGGCADINECAISQPCGPHGQCLNEPGTYSCRCDIGFEFSSGTCININECAVTNPCARNSQCVDTVGSYNCVCPPGTVYLNPKIEACQVINRNMCENKACYNEGTCRSITRNQLGSFTEDNCECIENFAQDLLSGSCRSLLETSCTKGFQSVRNGTQISCINIDECVSLPNVCLNGRCIDMIGSYTCECNRGHKVSRGPTGDVTCIDINECEEGVPCGRGTCTNTPGGYTCSCFDGFRLHEGPTCVEIKLCVERSPCGPQGTCMDTAPGKYICRCPPGFTFDGTTCLDLNECAASSNPCVIGDCINTIGSYVCRCPMGYTFVNSRCVDVDECAISNPCAPGECHNSDGSYFCVCPAGYTRQEPGICVDVNECVGANPCGDGKGLCINTLGSFQCQCLPGFSFDSATRTCISIDECAVTAIATLCLPGECQNTIGSYRCICPAGYEATNTPFLPSGSMSSSNNVITNEVAIFPTVTQACFDVNECVRNPQLCAPGNCLNTIGSYYCICPTGFTFTNGICADINECTDKTVCGSGICRNTIGSYECSCPPGFTFDRVTCVDLNECVLGTPCGSGTCVNTIGSFTCVCPTGYQPGPNQVCVDINECIGEPTICGPGTCVNTIGSYVCRCPIGYYTDRGTCFAINECEAPGLCGVGNCVDLMGSYQCQCPPGFEFSQGTCLDINECTQTAGPCPDGLSCRNTVGSFQCVAPPKVLTICVQSNPCSQGSCVDVPPDRYTCNCPPGQTFDGRTCIDINECTSNPNVCLPGNCVNLPGTYLCVCPFGFTPSDGTCVDVNECLQQGVCGVGSCQNTIGSYSCICPPGFESVRGTCVEINECTDVSVCGPGNTCENLPGAYRCICRPGFSFDARTCVAINECTLNPNICQPGVCENTFGSYRCICPVGFQSANGTCVDINECMLGTICGTGTCQNTIGSYQCICLPGYRFIQGSCYDINECAEKPDICGLGTCQNLPGSYQCFCPPGYAFRDGTCIDINECTENPLICNRAQCRNTLGSYICFCPEGFTIDMTTLTCRKECAPGYILINEMCVPVTTTTRRPVTEFICTTLYCGPNEQPRYTVDSCECVCIYGPGAPPNCRPPPTSPPPNSPPPRLIISTPPVPPVLVLITTTEASLPEASVHCLADGIEVVVSLNSQFQGVIYVKNYSRDENCRRLLTGNEYRDNVVFDIKYGTCGVLPDGNVAEFVLVVQRHPTLVTIDATPYRIRCLYKGGEATVTVPSFTVRVNTIQGTIANAAPPPICRIIIMNFDGTAVSNANIGQNLQLKVEVSPYNVYGGFASNCMAIAVDNSWKFQVTDIHGCATDRTIFTEWSLDPVDHSLRANFSAFKFPGASLLRFQCNIRICFRQCPPVICQPGGLRSYGKKKRQVEDSLYDVAPKGDVIEEIQVQSNGLQTFDVQSMPLNGSNSAAAVAGRGEDQVCLSAASFGVTLAITLLLALVAIAISISCWIMAYRKRPESDGSYYRSSATGYGNGTGYTNSRRGAESIPRVTLPRRDPDPDYQ